MENLNRLEDDEHFKSKLIKNGLERISFYAFYKFKINREINLLEQSPTGLEKESDAFLFDKFAKNKLQSFDIYLLQNIAQEIHNRVCKNLKITPCKVEINDPDKNESKNYLGVYYPTSEKIRLDKNNLQNNFIDNYSLFTFNFLFTLLHETRHRYQHCVDFMDKSKVSGYDLFVANMAKVSVFMRFVANPVLKCFENQFIEEMLKDNAYSYVYADNHRNKNTDTNKNNYQPLKGYLFDTCEFDANLYASSQITQIMRQYNPLRKEIFSLILNKNINDSLNFVENANTAKKTYITNYAKFNLLNLEHFLDKYIPENENIKNALEICYDTLPEFKKEEQLLREVLPNWKQELKDIYKPKVATEVVDNNK